MKAKNMKTIRNILLAGLTVVAVSLLSAPAISQAQEAKGATKLMWSKPITTAADVAALQPGDMVVMSCPKCQNSQAVVVEKSFKATVPDAKQTVTTHLCPSCTTKIVPQGGKQDAKVVHVCNSCGSEKVSCCAVKPGSAPTEGMSK